MAILTVDGKLNPHPGSFEQIDATSSAESLTVPADARGVKPTKAMIRSGGSLRWTDDGTTPSATVGMPLSSGEDMYYPGPLEAFQCYGAVIDVLYYY